MREEVSKYQEEIKFLHDKAETALDEKQKLLEERD